MMQIELEIPYPVSVNSYYRSVKGRSILSKQGRDYKKHAAQLEHLRGTFPATQRLKVSIQLFPPSKHRSDLDNYAKSALDLMQDAGVFVNDNQIDHLVIRRRSVLKGGKAIVTIKVIRGNENTP